MPRAHSAAAHTAVMITIRIDKDARFNMSMLSSDQRTTIGFLVKFADARPLHYPVLLCLVTGPPLPQYCVEMSRSPIPPKGAVLDDQFGDYYATEVARTPALHDGAVILSRSTAESAYSVSGWSYRLISPERPPKTEPNRGSAYNSAVSMSFVDHVDLVALILESGIEVYVQGQRLDLLLT